MPFFRTIIGGSVSSSWTEVEAVSLLPQGANLSISNLTVGHLYHLFVSSAGSSRANAESNMAITANSGTSGLTLVDKATARESSYYSTILHYTFTATSATAVFDKTSSRYMGYILYDTNGGGSETETTLWTNPSPASAFSAQTITLSNAYTNYKRLRFYFRNSTSVSTEYFVEYTKEEIGKWWDGSASTTMSPVGGMPYYRSGANYSSRVIRRTGASVTNQFWISQAYNMNSSGTGTAYGIPTKITGII